MKVQSLYTQSNGDYKLGGIFGANKTLLEIHSNQFKSQADQCLCLRFVTQNLAWSWSD